MEVQELKRIRALRAFATDANLDEAAAALLKQAREMEICPQVIHFTQMPEYEDTGEYQIVLWGS